MQCIATEYTLLLPWVLATSSPAFTDNRQIEWPNIYGQFMENYRQVESTATSNICCKGNAPLSFLFSVFEQIQPEMAIYVHELLSETNVCSSGVGRKKE